MKKYKLTNNKIEWFEKTLYQIESLIDFDDVKKGDKGGYIEKEENLSHCGNAWVYPNALVRDDAEVYGDAKVCDNAKVCGNAWVKDKATVCGNAWVCGNAMVYENAFISGNVLLCGNTGVCGNAVVSGDAKVSGTTKVSGDAEVYGDEDLFWVTKIGSKFGTTTVFKNKDGGLTVSCGCFLGTLDEFANKVNQTHGDNKYAKEYKALIELIKIHFEVEE